MHRVLRDRICLLRYRPGELLVETELAAEFNVSRTPIRQALQRLDYEGLVETRNGVGTTVTGVDFQEFKDVYAFRLKLSEMIGDFSKPDQTPKSLQEVEGLIPRIDSLIESRDFEQFWQINHELHFAINALIGNTAMREIHDRLYFLASRVWYSFVDRMWDDEVRFLKEEVDELCRALRAGDLRAVGFVQRNFISYGLSRVARYISTG
ncbi:GntR family transcriptional regulator [Sinorhizobium meliloti]|nr:GntR family transcriptional regulator [Sinorhizobium meliloti]MDX1090764.1 GntR family transcriptional regulator [Sinorhizobium medicae]MDW9689688.1 GntR family transcriptional regulator [Sinorhizobium meliloti]MDX0134670.1 GntR family transcriptional regulator [Sinorhizobium meliloti]RVH15951.1 GntR family transcriptional regulator [Sinorhizobium meliloti]